MLSMPASFAQAVNPALTMIANALRVGDHFARANRRTTREARNDGDCLSAPVAGGGDPG